MSQLTYRANLEGKSFPFLSQLHGRTVIVKGQDQNYVQQMTVKAEGDKTIGIPQAYYMHNAIPTTQGYKSIGYQQYAAPEGTTSFFTSAFMLQDDTGNRAVLGVTSDGRVFILNPLTTNWIEKTAPVGYLNQGITTAYVSGITYIYFAGIGCYQYDWTASDLVAVTLTGLVAADIIGIVSQSGYLVAFSSDSIAYSSTVDPTDFVPSLSTGAGGGQVEGAQGTLVTAVPIFQGFILFTTKNAVAVAASGNVRYPFTFTAIPGAGGLSDPQYVSYDTNTGAVYAYTTSGLQTISLRQATTIFPEITDFLSGSLLEDFNESTLTFSTTTAPAVIKKRLHVVSSRYLIISYGYPNLTHALWVDIALGQLGKLKQAHVDCFEFQLYDQSLLETPKKSVALLQTDGTLLLVNSDISFPGSGGVILLGKYQYARARFLQLEAVDVENASGTLNCYSLPSLDGRNLQTPVTGYAKNSTGLIRTYSFHSNGLNHSILLKGDFDLNSLLLTFTLGGAR